MLGEPFQPLVYIMASQRNGTLYTGSTAAPVRRIWQHRNGEGSVFTRRYGCRLLVWYEVHDLMENAILLELRIKEWKRAWKLELIETRNPQWLDLFGELCP